MGHIVPMDKKNDRGKVMQCTTMADIVRDHNITHVDFMSLDVEDHEPHVLQTWPEERDGFTVDLILIENEKTSKVPGRCHSPHLMRYPFWNRGYGMLGFHGEPQVCARRAGLGWGTGGGRTGRTGGRGCLAAVLVPHVQSSKAVRRKDGNRNLLNDVHNPIA